MARMQSDRKRIMVTGGAGSLGSHPIELRSCYEEGLSKTIDYFRQVVSESAENGSDCD